MAITIKDVAKKAKVSVSTVSRALNGYLDVNPETRLNIEKVANDLGYFPNRLARNLSSKKKDNVAIIISGLGGENPLNEFTGNILRGTNQYLDKCNMTVAMYNTSSRKQEEQSLKDFCHEYSLDGVILIGFKTTDRYLQEIKDMDIPCVGIDITLEGDMASSILTNEVEAFEEITDYVIKSNPNYLILVKGKEVSQVTKKRYEGFLKSVCKLEFNQKKIIEIEGNFDEETTYEKVYDLLKKKDIKNSAFVCMSDLMAIATQRAIKKLGYTVPGDFSVTGFDGIHLLDYISPKITTIDQKTIKKGYVGMKLLREIIEGTSYPKDIYVPHQFILGESVK